MTTLQLVRGTAEHKTYLLIKNGEYECKIFGRVITKEVGPGRKHRYFQFGEGFCREIPLHSRALRDGLVVNTHDAFPEIDEENAQSSMIDPMSIISWQMKVDLERDGVDHVGDYFESRFPDL